MNKTSSVVIGVFIGGIIIIMLTIAFYPQGTDISSVPNFTTPTIELTPTPSLIKCYDQGKTVYATEENCKAISEKKNTEVIYENPPPGLLPPTMQTCTWNGPWLNCF